MGDKVNKTDAEWRAELSAEQFSICRRKGTEAPFSGAYWDCDDEGIYRCVCCGEALFDSDSKFDSGSGWPSFSQPLAEERVSIQTDTSHGMVRSEILCRACGAHLGHVFNDGPQPGGLRYCVNSVSLKLDRKR